MYLIILILPLLNLIITCVFGRFLGRNSFVIVIINLLISFMLSLVLLYEVNIMKYICFIKLGSWINIGILRIDWIFLFDEITCVMLLLVIFISLLVHIYSIEYMCYDPHIIRFVGYLSLFTFFMIVLVTAGNFVQLFLGWEGVGLSSYLLINFWYTRVQANKSAMKAIIVNRFGDVGLYLAILLIFFFFRTFDFSIIFTSMHFYTSNFELFGLNEIDLISLCICLGAVGKSAQIGLHTWLPDAMEGPTPVSALIHAATMVTAGIFVLIRCSPILEYSPTALVVIMSLGAITTVMAGTIGVLQNDIKKVIAYSTCSQLGFMFYTCGISAYSHSLFHLFNHGFFKALLFLGAGSIIHALSDEQDMRKMGGLVNLLPFSYLVMLIGSLSLIGFPFSSGFYSKEPILAFGFIRAHYHSFPPLGVLDYMVHASVILTTFYSFRLMYLVFFSKTNSNRAYVSSSHESNYFMFYSLIILSFITIFIGFIFKDAFVGLGSDFLSSSVFQLKDNLIAQQDGVLDLFKIELDIWSKPYHKRSPIMTTLYGTVFSLIVYLFCKRYLYYFIFNGWLLNIYKFFLSKWRFDEHINEFVYCLLKFSYSIAFKLIDRGIIEYFGPLSVVRFTNKLSGFISQLQTGLIYNYIFFMFLFTIFFAFIIIFNPAINLYWCLCVLCVILFLIF